MGDVPVIRGFHFIFTAYGFWLPNDPRGSWSTTIRKWELLRYGEATKTDARHSLAEQVHDYHKRIAAKRLLKYPPVHFTGAQARAIALGFKRAAEEGEYVVHALAVLPEHTHLVMARHERHVDQIASHLKAKATRQLSAAGLHPLAPHKPDDPPSPWARGKWCVFINDESQVRAAIEYTEKNPEKEGKPRQYWTFITPRDI